jgi:hypothetical protein
MDWNHKRFHSIGNRSGGRMPSRLRPRSAS